MTGRWRRNFALGATLALAGAGAAAAPKTEPPRPDGPPGLAVEEVEVELERTRAAMCAKSDFDGDSYRPFVCDPRCDCLNSEFISELERCEETTAGTFVASQADLEAPPASCVSPQTNLCRATNIPDPFFTIIVDACATSGLSGCFETADCPSGEVCSRDDDGTQGRCYDPCTSIADCAQPPSRCETSIACQHDGQCPDGWSCALTSLFQGTCRKTGCTSNADCELVLPGASVTFAGVGPADSPAPVECSVSTGAGDPVTTPINSNDALFCISQIEAVTGACD